MTQLPLSALARIAFALLVALLVGGCDGATPERTDSPVASAPTLTPPAAPSPTAAATAVGQPCRLESARPPDDAHVPASTVVRTYRDDGRTIALVQGRGDDRSGDYGWAHIRDKHLYGIWSGGGLVTTFPEIGVCDESSVQEIVGRALRDGRRRAESGGRAAYTWPAPGTRYDVLVIVGADGTIITAYPARR